MSEEPIVTLNSGHFKKGDVPWNKGKHFSEKSKEKMRLAHLGVPLSKEHRRKISLGRKGKSFPHKGHIISYETAKKISKALLGNQNPKGRIVSQETREKLRRANSGKTHSEKTKQKLRELRLRQIFPKKDTSIEIAIQKELDRRDIIYQKHVPVCGTCQPDIVFPELKIAVFCDGYYWHTKDEHAIEKDIYQNRVLTEAGWMIIRFWESEIKSRLYHCVDEIENTISMRTEGK